MATISITIPDSQLQRVVDAMCAAYGHTPADGPRPAFARRQLVEHVRDIVRGVELAAAKQSALSVVSVPDADIT